MEIGKTMRLGRLLRRSSGRSVIAAMDHGRGREPEGLELFEPALKSVLEARPDAVLIGPGAFVRYHTLLAGSGVGVVVALDMRFTTTYPGGEYMGETHECTTRLEELAAMGVDGVKVLYVFGREEIDVHARNARFIAELVQASWRWGVPVMVETVLWGRKTSKRQDDPDLIRHILRAGWETGGDLLKVALPSDPGAFSSMVKASPVPVLILGGARSDAAIDVLEAAHAATRAGAHGVVFGRNVWQHEDPAAMVRGLKAVVHDGASPASALASAGLK